MMENQEAPQQVSGVYTIASDVRCGPTDYTNDHIWELRIGRGEPPALTLQTTYGLRSRYMRIFPRFIDGDHAITDPEKFYQKPYLLKLYPNYLSIRFAPFIGIDVNCEYWVPSSNQLSGRIHITNTRLTQRKIIVQLVAILSPTNDGFTMTHQEIESSNILHGRTGDLFPAIYLLGSPKASAGPYPALSVKLNLLPGSIRQLTWAHSAKNNLDESFKLSKQRATINWDAEISRLNVINEFNVEIRTGNPTWNEVFRLTQINALRLMVGPTSNLPNPSFVLSRHLDHGHSPIGTGMDYSQTWNGQTPLEADYICSLLLPAATDLAIGILDNFISTIISEGFIDQKPGLGGQRARILATPILINLTWQIYQSTEDNAFLAKYFPPLLSYIQAWFKVEQDQDRDGLPEWENLAQSGFEDNPIYSRWEPWSFGSDISKVETPSLCSFLFNEIKILIKIANILDERDHIPTLEKQAEVLKKAVDKSWNTADGIYQNWDYESHQSPIGEMLGNLIGSGDLVVNRKFQYPTRINIHAEFNEKYQRKIMIFIHGIGSSGNQVIERIDSKQFSWQIETGKGTANTERLYQFIEYIEVQRIGIKDQITFQIMEITGLDQTQLLPLWAGIPDKKTASELILRTICDPQKFWRQHGIPACIQSTEFEGHPCWAVHMIWNNLIGEGLLKYGYQKEAAELVTKLIDTIAVSIRNNKTFSNYYHSELDKGLGESDSVGGLAPIKLFMESLGVRIISPVKVLLNGVNPFPWPVTIHYKGLTINREADKTKIIFPGGQSAIIKSKESRLVTLDKNHENEDQNVISKIPQ